MTALHPKVQQKVYALAIDGDYSVTLSMFRSEEEMNQYLWDYAFDNSGTDSETLDAFKEECDGELSEAMDQTGDGYQWDYLEV